MMTGEDYKASLLDGRAVYFDGEKVKDMSTHHTLGDCVRRTAEDYDFCYRPDNDAVSPLSRIPKSAQDLRDTLPLQHQVGMLAHVTYTSLMTLTTAAGKLTGKSNYVENAQEYVRTAQKEDIRVTQCITDAKGNRGLPPSKQEDADAYVHVVDRGPDGVVLRGAKLHITGASLGHDLLTIPTKAMKSGEDEYAIACAVPVSSPGAKIIDVSYAPQGRDLRNYPISGYHHYPESFVIFEDVFVPKERIFLDGDVSMATVFAHSLGLWERMAGIAHMADEYDALVGFAQLIAEANGVAGIGHIKDKISDMIVNAALIRSSLEAAITHCVEGPNGAVFPDELYVNAGKYFGAANFALMARSLHDIAGASVITAPSVGDLENPETGYL